MKNPTVIKLCISHKIATSRYTLLKVTVLIKAIIKIIYNKLINQPGRLTPLPTITMFYSHHDPDPSKILRTRSFPAWTQLTWQWALCSSFSNQNSIMPHMPVRIYKMYSWQEYYYLISLSCTCFCLSVKLLKTMTRQTCTVPDNQNDRRWRDKGGHSELVWFGPAESMTFSSRRAVPACHPL